MRRVIRPSALLAVIGLAVPAAPMAARALVSAVPSRPDDTTIVHVLNRVGFGPRPGEVEQVREMGIEAWIDRQLHPERIADAAVEARLDGYETLHLSSRAIAEEYFLPARQARRERQREKAAKGEVAGVGADTPALASGTDDTAPERRRMDDVPEPIRRARQVIAELTAQKILRAVYGNRQLEEVLTDFWFNHFNVFAGKGLTRVYLTEYERDAIRPHVLGRFRDLLGATAKSPAMLFYLDNARSADPSFAQGLESRGYLDGLGGREPPGRPERRRRQGGGGLTPEEIDRIKKNLPTGINENYARELMELHTLGVDGGYTQQDVVNVARALTGWTIGGPRSSEAGRFVFNPRMHDTDEKIVLGHRIKAGGGIDDGEQVLDILASHPSTARFISSELVRRFVADEPPPAMVDRAAATFRRTGGDLRAVMRTILTSPEFLAPDAYRAKVKTPFDFVVSALRATDANILQPFPLERTLQQLGMPLYFCQPPTGYKDTAETWVNTGALINRMNFALALAENKYRGVVAGDVLPDDNRSDAETAVTLFLTGAASEATRATIERATTPAQVVALALGSPEFQRK